MNEPKAALSEVVASARGAAEKKVISVLMVDDQAIVGAAVKRMLADEGDIEFHFCGVPGKAMEMVESIRPTVILQDLVMPDIDGLDMVAMFRADERTRDVPMIVLSSREEPDIKQKAFALGANDYMVKLPDKLEVVARIRYHSQAYINLLERNRAFEALQRSQDALKAELLEAERYVTSLLPGRLESGPLLSDWVFMTSTDLGGDSFGYHTLDDEHFAIYLLDVCGHGVGAALLSVSAMNVLRAGNLADTDFRDPAAVLSGLNEVFDMDKQNQMYFTIWYGVIHLPTGTLRYSSGGHPPAVLVHPGAASGEGFELLSTPGMVIGGMPGMEFAAGEVKVSSGDRLYVFSDGVYEIDYADGSGMMTVETFAAELRRRVCAGEAGTPQRMVEWVRQQQGRDDFEDDFSLCEFTIQLGTAT